MKKNLNPFLIAVVSSITLSAIIFACSDNSNQSYEKHQFDTKSLNASPDYLNQMSFISGGDTQEDMDFILDNHLYEKMEDSNIDWTYFDDLYDSSLQNSLKQELSYLILCKKDLIGLVNNNPDNNTLVNVLKKHVDNLVETEYSGYTALYYALDALKSTGKETVYIQNQAAEIVQYSTNDPFRPDMMDPGPIGSDVRDIYDKFVDNFDYVSKIATLQ